MKIFSGGQTGVDRAALDAAIKNKIPHGGWCPKGRRAELDTAIPAHYNLVETPNNDFETRTMWNVRDSDGTLIFVPSLPVNINDGTMLTIKQVQLQKKPFLIVDCSTAIDVQEIMNWMKSQASKTLNIAGPRESLAPGIYRLVFSKLCAFFEILV